MIRHLWLPINIT